MPPKQLLIAALLAVLFMVQLVAANEVANLRGAPDLRRGNNNKKACQKAIKSLCPKRCKNLCLNQCYVDNMAAFNAIPGCVTAQGSLKGAKKGDNDFDNDGIKNEDDDDDDNDGYLDDDDLDVRRSRIDLLFFLFH